MSAHNIFVDGGDIGIDFSAGYEYQAEYRVRAQNCSHRGVRVSTSYRSASISAYVTSSVSAVYDWNAYRGIEVLGVNGPVQDLTLDNCVTVWSGPAHGISGIVVEGGSFAITRVRVVGCVARNGDKGIVFLDSGGSFSNNRVYDCYSDAMTPYAFDPGCDVSAYDNLPSTGSAGSPTDFIWAPSIPGGSAGNVYANWADLYTAVSAAPAGNKNVLVMAQWTNPWVDAGTWDVRGWSFRGWGRGRAMYVDTDTFFDIESMSSAAGLAYDLEFVDFDMLRFYSGTGAIVYAGDYRQHIRFERCIIDNRDSYWLDDQDGCLVSFVDTELYSPDAGFIGGWGSTTVQLTGKSWYAYGQLADASISNAVVVEYDVGSFSPYADDANVRTRRATLTQYTLPLVINATVPATGGSPEVRVGGGVFNPVNAYDTSFTSVRFEVLLATTAAGPVTVLLYEIGDTENGYTTATLRSTSTVTPVTGVSSRVLLPVDVPGVNVDEIMRAPGYADFATTAPRFYEVRVVADATDPIYVYWAGFKIDSERYGLP